MAPSELDCVAMGARGLRSRPFPYFFFQCLLLDWLLGTYGNQDYVHNDNYISISARSDLIPTVLSPSDLLASCVCVLFHTQSSFVSFGEESAVCSRGLHSSGPNNANVIMTMAQAKPAVVCCWWVAWIACWLGWGSSLQENGRIGKKRNLFLGWIST